MTMPPSTPSDSSQPDSSSTQSLGDQVNAAVAAAVAQLQLIEAVYAVVDSVQSGPPPSLTLTIQGDSASVAGISYLSRYTPNVGDTVLCGSVGSADLFVIDTMSNAQTAGNGFGVGDVLYTYDAATDRPGWVLRNGQAISRTTYARLFAKYGTVSPFGPGDGSTTFNVPDDRNLFVVGSDGTYTLGSTAGAATVTLSLSNLPSHSHANTATGASTSTVSPNPHAHFDGDNTGANSTASGTAHQEPGAGTLKSTATQSLSVATTTTVTMNNVTAGSGTSFSVLNPYRALKAWMKA